MGVRAFRWWRVTPEGVLTSVYQETRWEQPVLTASFVPRESYQGRIVRVLTYLEFCQESKWLIPNIIDPSYLGRKIIEIALPPQPHPFLGTKDYDYYKEGQAVGDIVQLEDPAGIYALRIETPHNIFMADSLVSGWVSLFGHIVEHEKGYRAEKALVCGPLKLWHGDAELAQRVASRYECEVETKQVEENQTWATITWPRNLRGVVYGTGQADPGV